MPPGGPYSATGNIGQEVAALADSEPRTATIGGSAWPFFPAPIYIGQEVAGIASSVLVGAHERRASGAPA